MDSKDRSLQEKLLDNANALLSEEQELGRKVLDNANALLIERLALEDKLRAGVKLD